jgi:hypothetical protein
VPDAGNASDLALITLWWGRLARVIPADVRGLWFGIADLALSDSGSRRYLYLAGCPTFDADDETAEWATEYCWWPDDRYVLLPTLAAIPEKRYAEVLDFAADLVRRLRPIDSAPQVQGAAVGFDDGDFVLV